MTLREPLRIAWKAAVALMRNEGFLLGGTLAYSALLAIFPFVLFLAALIGLYADADLAQRTIFFFSRFAPREVMDVVRPVVAEVAQTDSIELLSFGILGTLWATISGMEALRTGLNRAYDVSESRSFWRTHLQSLGLVFAFAAAVIFLSFVIVLGPLLLEIAGQWIHIPKEWEIFWRIVRYAIGLVVMISALSILYRYLPCLKQSWRQVLPGAVLSTLLWLILASLFSLYLEHARNYSVTYGSLSGVIITLLFFQFSAMNFLYGAEINQAIWEAKKLKEPAR